MPWLVLNGGYSFEFTLLLLFIIIVIPSTVYGLGGWWIMSHKMRNRRVGFLMGFVIGLGGNLGGLGVTNLIDQPAAWLGGFALAVVVLAAIALLLPNGEPVPPSGLTAPPKPDRSNLHQ